MKNISAEAEIRAIIEARATAVLAGDIDSMMLDVADDVVTFDVVNPLRHADKASSRERAREWVASFDGQIVWETRDLVVLAQGDLAFSHNLSHVTGNLKTGAKVDMWFRTTQGFRRTNNRWLIVHDHSSSPFDPASGQASLDLKPN